MGEGSAFVRVAVEGWSGRGFAGEEKAGLCEGRDNNRILYCIVIVQQEGMESGVCDIPEWRSGNIRLPTLVDT